MKTKNLKSSFKRGLISSVFLSLAIWPVAISAQIGRAGTETTKAENSSIGRAGVDAPIGRAQSFRIGRVGLQQSGENKIETSTHTFANTKKTASEPGIETLTKAQKLAESGKYQEAIELYKKIILKDPERLNARLGLSYALLSNGDFKAAKEEYKRVLTKMPNDAEACLNYGVALYACDEIEQATLHFNEALNKRKGNFPAAHFNLAISYAHQGDLERSIMHYKTAIEQRGKYSEAHNNLGLVYEALGDTKTAIEEFEKAIQERNTSYPLAHYNLGRCYSDQNRLEEALAQFKTAIQENKNFAEAYVELGNFYLLTSNTSNKVEYATKAAENYRRAIEIRKGFYPLAHDNLATALADQNKLKEAFAEYRIAFQQYQGLCPETLQNLITTISRKDLSDTNVYSVFSELSISDNVCNLRKRKQAKNIKERVMEQLKKYEELDQEMTNDVHYSVALAYISVGELKKAIDELNTAVESSSGKDNEAKQLLNFLLLN